MSSRPHWGQMLVATVAVMVLPAVIVGALSALGVISSVWIGVALSALLALAATSLGSVYWRRHATGDVLFSDLLLWGWLRRGRMERRLGRADDLLDQAGTADAEAKAEILRDLGVALDAQDPYLDGHSRRVARYATMTAQRLDLSDEQATRVRTAAMIHDIGKLRIPQAIVNKPGKLTDDEFEQMKQHAAEGGRMVECLGDPALAAAVRGHHERWDGSGYPDGLSGERIPLEARIISVVDTFDAIASERFYRAATPHAKVLKIIDEEAGRQFDPEAARAFISCYSDRRGATLWAAIASVPRQLVERLSVRPGEVASLLSAAVTASLVVAAGAIAAEGMSVASDPAKDPRAGNPQAEVISQPPATRSPQSATIAPATGTETPQAPDASASPSGGTRRSPGKGGEQSTGDIAGVQATSTPSRGRPSDPPLAVPAAATATPALELPALAPDLPGLPLLPVPLPEPTAESTAEPTPPLATPTREPTPPPLATPTSEPTAEPTRPPLATATPIPPEPTPDPLPPLIASTLPVFPTSTPTPPTHSKDDCKHGGWRELGYRNQGQCIAAAERRG